MSSSPFPSFPVSQITIPSTSLTNAAYKYVKENCSECTLNHCLRATAFGLILQQKFPPLATHPSLDKEAIVLSILLHDMGWATTKTLLSKDKRFEVDGANIARDFIGKETDTWDRHRLQLMWDSIALHTSPSIAMHKEAEVMATQLAIFSDFVGPHLPLPGNLISVDEYKEIVHLFPRLGFKEELRNIMCGLCRDKPETTFDNFVGQFGLIYGLDGTGGGREEYAKTAEQHNLVRRLEEGLDSIAQYEK